jgi:hypothetical protein
MDEIFKLGTGQSHLGKTRVSNWTGDSPLTSIKLQQYFRGCSPPAKGRVAACGSGQTVLNFIETYLKIKKADCVLTSPQYKYPDFNNGASRRAMWLAPLAK